MIPIVVVAHPDRAVMARQLAEQVDAGIAWDIETGGGHAQRCAATHLRALKSFRPGSPFVVVLEDDAVPVDGFRAQLDEALPYAPAPIVGLYLGTGDPASPTQHQIRKVINTARAWITADCLIGSVGYAVYTDLLDDVIDFIDGRDEELPLRISRWAQARHHDIAYCHPSLVDHADGDTIGHPWRGPGFAARKAWRVGTRDCWCTPPERLGHCPTWSGAPSQ